MADRMRWGIIATGNIASQFARGLAALPDADLVAVGSRSQAGADRFGDQFDVPHRHASYAGVVEDPDVDAVYIATPHSLHKDNMLLCLEAGKAVLCEKPFAINAQEARTAIDLARRKGVFLMEAMWTRFMPLMVELRRRLADGEIGDVRMVQADFGFRTDFHPDKRLFDPALGGGALLDVGVYPISLASMILGQPNEIASQVVIGETGVDDQSAQVFKYAGGEIALLSSAIRTRTPHEATIIGTEGYIRIHSRWWYPTTMTIDKPGQSPQTLEFPYEGNGYNYEAAEVQRCVAAGRLESEIMPWDETLAIMETMDQLRATWGLRYPMEAQA